MENQNVTDPNTENVPAVAPQAAVPSVSKPKGRGHEEESDLDDLEMPRAKLVQFTSAEAQAEDKSDRKDAGMIINSITKEELGKEFIPIFKFTNFSCWNPRKKDDPNFDPAFEPGKLIWTTNDRRDPRVVEGIKFGVNGEAPKVTKYINFLACFPGQSWPLVLSFAKTSLNAGKRLNTLTQEGDMFSKKFRLKVSLTGTDTKYFVLDVVPAGVPTPDEFRLAEEWYNDFRGRTIKVHDETEHDSKAESSWPE